MNWMLWILTIIFYCICSIFCLLTGSTDSSVGIQTAQGIVTIPRILSCPAVCKCSLLSEKIQTDCSMAKLYRIPKNISNETVILLLNNNRISANITHPLNFGLLVNLEHLDLSYNRIESLGSETFSGLSKLKYLSLAYNRLKSVKSFSKNVFKPLKILKWLVINGNCDSYIESHCSFPDDELGQLSNLERLVMDGFKATMFGPGFRKLKKLRYLKLDSGFCRLTSVTIFTFKNLEFSKLETLDLNDCHIEEVMPNSFRELKQLKTLILIGNDRLCAEGLKNTTIGLNATKIENLFLGRTCNHVQEFQGSGPFSNLRNTSLLKLDLERCSILNFSLTSIFLLPKSLLYLSLRDNKIIDAFFLYAIPTMPNLEYLDGSAQDRYHVNKVTNSKGRYIELEAAGSRNLQNLPENQTNRTEVSKKSWTNMLPKSVIQLLRKTRGIPWQSVIPLPPKLKLLNASFLRVNGYIHTTKFKEKNSLEVLDFSNSLLKGSDGIVYGLHHLKFLNLSNGALSFLDPYTFGDMKELVDINLSGNPLGNSVTKSWELLFSNQTNLQFLELSSASLKQLPWNIFANNKKMKKLSLASNFFETITFSVESLTCLELLDLTHNSIKHISQEVSRQFNKISVSVTVEINLDKNPLQCTCNYESFASWLASLSTYIRLSNNQTLKCMYNNNTEVNVMSLRHINFNIECATWAVLISCVFGFLFLLVLLGSAAYVYTQRWKLRYLYYIGKNNLNPYHPLLGENIDLITDVYISFDESATLQNGTELRSFVTTVLYSRLVEKQLVVKIRDELESEKLLYNTISQTVRTCRKVLVFLNKTYCKEFWNVFEFNMAAYEGIYTSRDMIIPVFVEGISPSDLSSEIKAFLSNRQIIQLTSDSHLDDFIDNLVLKIRQ